MPLPVCRAVLSFVLVALACVVFENATSPCLAQTESAPPALRSESTVVLVPTLVKTKSGDIVHGLSAHDFILEDDGVAQSVQLDDSPEGDPVSVVVAVQRGRTAALQLARPEPPSPGSGRTLKNSVDSAPLSGLGTMLESYVGEGKATVAVVAFDSHIQVLQDFTEDIPAAADRLRSVTPGDDRAVILDALLFSIDLLNRRPPGSRRVLILISEARDHGSRVTTLENVVRRVGVTNTLVYGLSFSPGRAELIRDLKGQNPNPGQPDLLKPFVMAVNGLRKNVASEIAQLSGGEYETFSSKRNFDTRMNSLANDDHNRYRLSFQPTNPMPGPHVIKVRLREPENTYVVTARSMYWAVAR